MIGSTERSRSSQNSKYNYEKEGIVITDIITNCEKTTIGQISVSREIVGRVFKIAFRLESTAFTTVSALRIIERNPNNRFSLIELSLVVSTQRYAIMVHYDTALVIVDVMCRTKTLLNKSYRRLRLLRWQIRKNKADPLRVIRYVTFRPGAISAVRGRSAKRADILTLKNEKIALFSIFNFSSSGRPQSVPFIDRTIYAFAGKSRSRLRTKQRVLLTNGNDVNDDVPFPCPSNGTKYNFCEDILTVCQNSRSLRFKHETIHTGRAARAGNPVNSITITTV